MKGAVSWSSGCPGNGFIMQFATLDPATPLLERAMQRAESEPREVGESGLIENIGGDAVDSNFRADPAAGAGLKRGPELIEIRFVQGDPEAASTALSDLQFECDGGFPEFKDRDVFLGGGEPQVVGSIEVLEIERDETSTRHDQAGMQTRMAGGEFEPGFHGELAGWKLLQQEVRRFCDVALQDEVRMEAQVAGTFG